MTGMQSYWRNYIDGAFVDGGAGRIAVDDPGSGEKLAEQAMADASDMDRAVKAAKRVHDQRLRCCGRIARGSTPTRPGL